MYTNKIKLTIFYSITLLNTLFFTPTGGIGLNSGE